MWTGTIRCTAPAVLLWLGAALVSQAQAQAQAEVADDATPPGETGRAEGVEGPSGGATAEPGSAPSPGVLRVVVTGNSPFVDEGMPPRGGIAWRIYEEVLDRLGREATVSRIGSAEEAIQAVSDGEADLAVGAISITAERARRVAFTQPWYQGALAIAARSGGESLWSRIRPFATRTFLGGVGTLLAVLLVVGTLFWLTERKRNPEHFPPAPVPGIANGIWLALVTMTTVGYGDRAPVTVPGRLVASVWMVVALLTASSLTAFLATALTLSQISAGEVRSASDLRGTPVAVVEGTTSAAFARRRGARTVSAADVDEALGKLVAQDVDAVVFDRPVLRWFLSEHPEVAVALSEASYEPVGYGFGLTYGDVDLRREINVALLDLAEAGFISRVVEERLGGDGAP